MPRLDLALSEDDVEVAAEGVGLEVAIVVVAPPPLPPPELAVAVIEEAPRVSARPLLSTKVSCGRGRWGNPVERHLVASRMREGLLRPASSPR